MNYVRVLGGLGNQMFQYTFSKYVEMHSNQPCILHMNYFDDVKKVQGAVIRELALDKMRTNYISVNGEAQAVHIVNEGSTLNPEVCNNLVYFNGYWQDKKYYLAVKDVANKDFEIKDEYITDEMNNVISEMESSNSVSLHVRRTDYLTENIVASDTYYAESVKYLERNISENLTFFVFSDDVSYAAGLMKKIGVRKYHIMPIRQAYQDMYLMSMAKFSIIANSTFSWWGAVLGEARNHTKLTIAPKVWFKDRPGPDIYFDDWIVI